MPSTQLSPEQLALLLAAGLAAGFLNALAGGGSLIMLPTMIFLGIPAPIANATNRVGLVTQNISASIAFHKAGRLNIALGIKLALVAVPGVIVGAYLAIEVPEHIFKRVLSFVLLLSLYALLRGKKSPEEMLLGGKLPHPKALLISFFFFGFYAGFVQAGLGFLIIAALNEFGGQDLIRTNALKLFIVFILQALALFLFQRAGKVDWLAGSFLAIGTSLGAWAGAHWQMHSGTIWVRRALIAILSFFAIRLFQDSFHL